MVRSHLYSAGHPPKYWSSALVHAVHLKNRIWYSALTCTPYKAWNHTPPNLSHLRVFGSLVAPRRPGPRPAKLDIHTYGRIFLGYEGSTTNIIYLDIHTGRVKNGFNKIFDEAHYTSTNRPPGPQFLFYLGLTSVLPPPSDDIPPVIHWAPAGPSSAHVDRHLMTATSTSMCHTLTAWRTYSQVHTYLYPDSS
jgi:hypothetical protein